jgi:hypothetical protein
MGLTFHFSTGDDAATSPTHPPSSPPQNSHAAAIFADSGRLAEKWGVVRARYMASPDIQLQLELA